MAVTPAPRKYVGLPVRTARGGFTVHVVGPNETIAQTRSLEPRRDLMNHSPNGFAWGYHGSGPAQLALAIVADHTGDDDVALGLYQEYKGRVVAQLETGERWTITSAEVERTLEEINVDLSRAAYDRGGPDAEP